MLHEVKVQARSERLLRRNVFFVYGRSKLSFFVYARSELSLFVYARSELSLTRRREGVNL